ncbi:MAG: ribonucleotide-diphosphate reductase subunit beta [bacterium]
MNIISNAEVINKRRIINGEDDGLMQVAPLKHPFADEIFKTMLKNNWVPQEVNLQEDIEQWRRAGFLTDNEKRVYKRSLAFVSNLDGIQTANLTSNIIRQITSPEVTLAVVRQAYEEALHVHSYATMIEALGFDPDEIYGMYKVDKELYTKNQYVLTAVNKIGDQTFKTGSFEADQLFLEACVGNVILEGIYFYSAFLNFYILRRNNKMPGSAQMIQFINRDEDMHLKLFINIVNTIKKEQPELWTPAFQELIIKNIEGAIEHELSWGLSCIQGGILGLNKEGLSDYLYFVGDLRLRALGLPKKWNTENPFTWLDEFTQGNMTESNFFESTVKEYSTGSLEW